jgi:hypothetical protein
MYCVALGLSNCISNNIIEETSKLIADERLSVIPKFHLTLFLMEDKPDVELINRIREQNWLDSNINGLSLYEGGITPYSYLALDISLVQKSFDWVEIKKKEFLKDEFKSMSKPFKPHISIFKGMKGSFIKDDYLSITFPFKHLEFDSILVYGHDLEIIETFKL